MNDNNRIEANPSAWEDAYQRFETPEQEVRKFVRRLRSLGVERWDRNLRILELLCGRGNGLHAWEHLGFGDVEGVDWSFPLLRAYSGAKPRCAADVRRLPFRNGSRDVVCVQGGLHHLDLAGDLDQALGEIHRVLRPDGYLVVVEPWNTPFLRAFHTLVDQRYLRRLSPKLDAFGTMRDLEGAVYERWLRSPDVILAKFARITRTESLRFRWGKIYFVGRRRA